MLVWAKSHMEKPNLITITASRSELAIKMIIKPSEDQFRVTPERLAQGLNVDRHPNLGLSDLVIFCVGGERRQIALVNLGQ